MNKVLVYVPLDKIFSKELEQSGNFFKLNSSQKHKNMHNSDHYQRKIFKKVKHKNI